MKILAPVVILCFTLVIMCAIENGIDGLAVNAYFATVSVIVGYKLKAARDDQKR